MPYKISYDASAACTAAYSLIAEAWQAMIEEGLVPDMQGVPPVKADSGVIWAQGDEGDPCGVLVMDVDFANKMLVVRIAYVEPTARRKGAFTQMMAVAYEKAQQWGLARMMLVAAVDDPAIVKVFGDPVEATYELKVSAA